MSSLDRILPFLRPIEDLLRDPSVTELMVNDGTSIECDLVLMTDWKTRLPTFSAKVAGG